MRRLLEFIVLILVANGLSPASDQTYPVSRKSDKVEQYHGVAVPNPYDWLEDLDSAETSDWVARQNKQTFDYLAKLPDREAIRQRLTQVWNYAKYEAPVVKAGKYFYFKNDGLQNQDVLYIQDSLQGEPRVLLDPNTLASDGTAALSGLDISPDGRYLAYGISRGGSDWQEWFVRTIATGKDEPDHIQWVKFSDASFDGKSEGLFYSRYDQPAEGELMQGVNYNQKCYYHKLGTDQSADRLIYERPDHKDWGFYSDVSQDGRFLIISVWKGSANENGLFYLDLSDPKSQVVPLFSEFDAAWIFIDNRDGVFWLQTNKDAPQGKVVAVDLADPSTIKTLIPEAEETLAAVATSGGRLVATYFKDALSRIKIFKPDGSYEKDLKLPGLGTANWAVSRFTDHEAFFTYEDYTTPPTVYRYDFSTGKRSIFRKPEIDMDLTRYVSKQVFYHSKDGTRVPMMITHRKDLVLNGGNPTLLFGYGGFGVSVTPSFKVATMVWMEMGGVFAVPNLRGGGEYGEEWHQAGTKANKQNVFDDFIAAAEWLIENKYTSPEHLGIFGGSNGGLLVGACMTQRPDLFAVALPAVGVMDMLRFQKFTIGWAWVADYGSSDNAEDVAFLLAYSPLHNLKEGVEYPATLITTGDHDDRVVPSHSFKFAAELQARHKGDNPVLIRIDTKAGHGSGKPTSKIIEETADRWAFLAAHSGKKTQKSF